MDFDVGLDSIQSARQATKDDTWDGEAYLVVATDDDGFDEPFGQAGARLYQGVAAWLTCIAPSRPDIVHAVKEAVRSMSAPREGDLL